MNSSAVGRVLSRLEAMGAAHRLPEHKWVTDPLFDPDTAARRLGLVARQQARHAQLEADEATHDAAVAAARTRHQQKESA